MIFLLTWHFFVAPVWILTLAWNLQRALARYFSVSVMLRTLFSHWHKDAVSYKQGTISGIALAFAWNSISRLIGFVVRVLTLSVYVVIATLLLVVSIAVLGVFLLWPLAAILGLITAIGLLQMQ